MSRIVLTVLVVLMGMVSWVHASESPTPAIAVSGTCVRSVPSDLVEVAVGVKARDADSQKAMAKAAAIYEKALKNLKALGLKQAEFLTTNMTVQRLTEYQNGRNVDKGFEANYAVSVLSGDMGRVGEIFKVAKEVGANEVFGPSFRLSKTSRKKEYEACLEEAVRNARAKAETMAKTLGVGLSGKVLLQENELSGPVQPMAYEMRADMAMKGAAPTVESKKEDVQVNVQATFFLK